MTTTEIARYNITEYLIRDIDSIRNSRGLAKDKEVFIECVDRIIWYVVYEE